MPHNQLYSNLIYEYFVSRILFRYYKYGDCLPSVEVLCHQFSVGNLTVKAALRRMKKEGYISMGNGTITKVIYQQTDQGLTRHILQFFSERWTAYSDLFLSGEQIFIPLFTQGLRQMTSEELDCIWDLANSACSEDLIRSYSYILNRLKNPLALNLLWETSIFQGFPYVNDKNTSVLHDPAFIKESFHRIIAHAKASQWDKVFEGFLQFHRKTIERLLLYFGARIQPAEHSQQLTFSWRIYRERPQLCYNLAVRILHENSMGGFQGQEFLPSYEKMASNYNVSVSTMRRTIGLLCQLGAAYTVNGKGTHMVSPLECSNAPDFSSNAIRRNLAYFIQAFELIYYTCDSVLRAILTYLSCEGWTELADNLAVYVRLGHCELTAWHMVWFLSQNSPLAAVRDIYNKLYGLFLWGYSLKVFIKNDAEFKVKCSQYTETLIKALHAQDIPLSVSTLKEMFAWELPRIKEYLHAQGMTTEDLYSSPSIMLLL